MDSEKRSIVRRHNYILEALQKRGELKIAELSDELGVSSVTLRKDVKMLEDKRLLFHTHGNIHPIDQYMARDVSVNEKEYIATDEKMRIAQRAATLIDDNDAIIIASGTTVLFLARLVEARGSLTVLTSALNVGVALCSKPDVEIIHLGGAVRKTSTSVSGPFAQQMLSQFSCSKLFLGVDGIDLEYGCTTSSMMEANVNQCMISAARRTIVLADSSKFGKRGFGRICSFERVHQIITDDKVSDSMVGTLEDMGVEVTVV
ncbi:MAG: DeoR/GlpR family DNA-binding transcription regulator [Rikenellaceae bacterium]|jgi:DeoR family transcriptional regulator of aga operon|nr:DeoR/GlpR family DNA-binding transcription regulator [Rikenellaceae bacterium]